MYRALLIDDDILVRMDLRTLVDWDMHDVELLEDGSNGQEGIQQIHRYKPDLILLDIEMPVMSGLEVIRQLRREKYEGKIIVLSFHDDFDNVSEALKNGACEYILKDTISAKSLNEVLTRVLHKVEENRQESSQWDQITQMSFKVQQEHFVKGFITGVFQTREQIAEKRQSSTIPYVLAKYVIATLRIDNQFELRKLNSKAQQTQLLQSASEIIFATLKEANCMLASIADGEYCIVMDLDPAASYMRLNSTIFEICQSIIANLNRYLNLQASMGLSQIENQISQSVECYNQSRLAMDARLYLGLNVIIHYSELEHYKNKREHFLADYEQELQKAIFANEAELEQLIHRMFADLKQNKVNLESIKLFYTHSIIFILRLIKEFNLEQKEGFDYQQLLFHEMDSFETLENMCEWYCEIFIKMNHTVSQSIGNSHKSTRVEIQKAIDYIHRKYSTDITLQEIADYSKLSRTYFSQIFNHEMKETFTEYLARYRIEKAKHLLKLTGMRVFEIGTACGIPNYRYFTTLFKELSGVTPSQYRDNPNITDMISNKDDISR